MCLCLLENYVKALANFLLESEMLNICMSPPHLELLYVWYLCIKKTFMYGVHLNLQGP
jgi:hypothetical protein